MRGTTARWLAWGLGGSTPSISAPTLLLAWDNEPSSVRNAAVVAVLILAFSSVGALISSRRPENPIGWLFLSGAFAWILGELALECAVYVLAAGSPPAAAWLGWFGGWARGAGWFLVVVLPLLLFPTGSLPSRRWRPVLGIAVAFILFFTLVVWLSPVSEDLRLASVGNPMGLDLGFMSTLREVEYLLLPPLLVTCGASVVVRFRGAGGDERQQLKWFAYAVAVMVLVFATWLSLALAGLVPPDALMWAVPLLGLPAGVGVAVLRYRLYDIDVVINRTLVYAVLTAALALVYLAGVASSQYVLRALTGGETPLAVVLLTLTIAALFSPLRRHVQAFVDRRFYREKYDARRTLEAYAAKLRDGTDLDRLSGKLVSAAHRTMRPAHASLWLRGPGRDAQKTAAAGAAREQRREAGGS